MTDGGPDWSPKSNVNEFFLSHLQEDKNLDMLVAVSFAPGQSRFNPVEHLWASCSHWLARVSLSPCFRLVPSPSRSHVFYSMSLHIDVHMLLAAKAQVFTNALASLNSYWEGKVHDSFRVTSTAAAVPGNSVGNTRVKTMFDSSLRHVKEDNKLLSYM